MVGRPGEDGGTLTGIPADINIASIYYQVNVNVQKLYLDSGSC
jgi:hypothetical protein